MAHWRKNEANFVEIANLLEENPDISAREVARRLEIEPSTVIRILPSMEEVGILLAEDDHGRLQVVARRR